MILAIFNCFFVPIQAAFDLNGSSLEFVYSPAFIILNFVIDFLFFVDIVLNFRTVYLDERGEWC